MVSLLMRRTCVYISVVLGLSWPKALCIYLKLVPACIKCVAKLCLSVCGVAQASQPLAFTACRKTRVKEILANEPACTVRSNYELAKERS